MDLSELGAFELINYSSNMLNEYSLKILCDQAINLKEVVFYNIDAFSNKENQL